MLKTRLAFIMIQVVFAIKTFDQWSKDIFWQSRMWGTFYVGWSRL